MESAQGPCGRRDGQAVVAGQVIEGECVVDTDGLGRSARPERGDVNLLRRAVAHPPDLRRREVADRGRFGAAARQDGGPQAPARSEPRHTDDVHAPMHAMQPSARHLMLDPTARQPDRMQLGRCDHTFLLRRQRRDSTIWKKYRHSRYFFHPRSGPARCARFVAELWLRRREEALQWNA